MFKKLKTVALVSSAFSASILLLAAKAHSEDYPLSGLFWPSPQDVDVENLEARCALSFLEQRTDGNWFVYHVALEEFKRSRVVKYLQVANGHCTFEAEQNVETCVTFVDKSFPEGEGKTTFDIVTDISEDTIKTVFFEDRSALDSARQNPEALNSGLRQNYERCPYSEQILLSRSNSEVTSLSVDALNALRFPTNTVVSDPIVDLLVQTLWEE